jgi:ABC-2 type transport system ATP-binding protein
VAIVDQGQVIALGRPAELIARLGGEHVVEFTLAGAEGASAPEPGFLADLPAVRSVRREAGQFCLSVTEPHVALPALLTRLQQGRYELASLSARHASLEDVFVSLTGRHLRDGEAAP